MLEKLWQKIPLRGTDKTDSHEMNLKHQTSTKKL